MARPFSIKALAELIADGYDNASAATEFNTTVEFIERTQGTDAYLKQLAFTLKKREDALTRRFDEIESDTPPILGYLDPVSDYLGHIVFGNLQVVRGVLEPIPYMLSGKIEGYLEGSEFQIKLGDPFIYKL